jgi:hypothetical protein
VLRADDSAKTKASESGSWKIAQGCGIRTATFEQDGDL